MYDDDDGPAAVTLEEARETDNRPLPVLTAEGANFITAYLKKRLHRTGDRWVDFITFSDPWKLHALGVVAVRWSSCEGNLLHLLAVNRRVTVDDVRPEADKHDTSWQFRQVLEAVQARGFSDHVLLLLRAAADAFDVCRLNRNALLHAGQEMRHGSNRLHLTYRKRRASKRQSLDDDLQTIRRIADEIKTLDSHLSMLWAAMISNRATVEVMLADEEPIKSPARLVSGSK
jgi:hypothetical protein